MLDDLDSVLAPGLTHWQSPRFFAYFATTASEPGVLAELLIAGLNQVGILWRTSPALQELEEVDGRLAAPARRAPARSFAVTSRTPRRRECSRPRSWRARSGPTGACSSAPSMRTRSGEKAARLLDLELRKVPTDDEFRMRPDLLGADDACAVIATIGTTGMASVDPVPEIAERCAAAGAWLHVDAAYAGSAAILPELRHHFAGWERADSIGVNPHKWLGVPMDCSVLWTRRQDGLPATPSASFPSSCARPTTR